MDFIRAQYERIRKQLEGLSASQRMLTVTLLVIMGITLTYWVRYAGKPEMEALLDQPMAAEDIARIRGKLDGMGVAYQVAGDRVMVSAEKRQGVLAALSFDQALPQNTSAGWDSIIKQINPWNSESQNAQWWLQAKQAKLAEVMCGWPGVLNANVIIDATEHRGFGDKNVRQSATVSIKMRDAQRPNKKLASAAADLVAGAQAGLDRGRIKVLINGMSFSVQDQGEDSIGGAEDLVEYRQLNEEYYTRKITNQLGWLNSEVFVQVTVDINNKSTQQTQTTYDPKGTAKVETKITSKSTDENTDSKGGGEPGVGANTQASVADSGGGGGSKQSRNESVDETEFQSGLSSNTTMTKEGPGAAKVVAATVRVPWSYFLRVYKERNPTAKDPDDATLQPYLERELAKIRNDVRSCTAMADDKNIAVETYADTVLTEANNAVMASAAPASGVGVVVGLHGKEIALGALAVISLFMMSMMVKKGTPAPIVTAAPEPTGPVPQLANGEEVVGEAGDGEEVLGGMELDSDAAHAQQMLGQVAELVKENPDAAANLIKRWMNK